MKMRMFWFKEAAVVAYGWLSGFLTPTFLCLAFNYMHGVGENPDGDILVPFGIIILAVMVIIDVIIVLNIARSKQATFKKAIALSLFTIAKAVGLLMIGQNDWMLFFNCFNLEFLGIEPIPGTPH